MRRKGQGLYFPNHRLLHLQWQRGKHCSESVSLLHERYMSKGHTDAPKNNYPGWHRAGNPGKGVEPRLKHSTPTSLLLWRTDHRTVPLVQALLRVQMYSL